ncbi:UDP-N-acetylglucosamine 2-epimerase (hydrolyzing) [Candidatus Pacearchaeota archaeon]|nr:UDP-N-acetylglucosamine 2-epimerase (hydrolyzing) [Candidatus Pacearchaeota archaeon]|tara:strand:- start:664 stop:1806 length:1143 start_codon:yes stop_codon:yes gene_type:complete
MRNVFVVTERRADFSRFKPILELISDDVHLNYDLVVTGIHLLDSHGKTINEIKDGGFKVFKTIKMFEDDIDRDSGAEMTIALGRVTMGLVKAIEDSKPDIILSGFDIGANLAVSIAGAHMNIPVVHIQGGEVSGTIDESIRHAVSKFSHYHLVSNNDAKNRLIRMGEIPKHIFVVGCPSIDAMLDIDISSPDEIKKKFNIDVHKKFFLVLQHPVTTELHNAKKQIKETLKAVKKSGVESVLIYPNNDAGFQAIIGEIKNSNIKYFTTLSLKDYVSLLSYTTALIGNSSSGIHETATFKVPTINIGTRQQGRLRPRNVIDVDYEEYEITGAINKILNDKKFLKDVKYCINPYGDGKSASRIIDILKKINIGNKIIQKRITY